MSGATSFYVMHAGNALYNVPSYEAAVAKIDAEPACLKAAMTIWSSAGIKVGEYHPGIHRVVKVAPPNCTFEVGKTYWCTSIGDSECVYSIKVIRRTAKTLYVTDEGGKAKTLRIKADYDGHESVAPKGSYSMSPTISASKVRS